MSKVISLEKVFGASFVKDAKKTYPALSEVMQYHLTQWIVKELALYIKAQFPELTDSVRNSKDIVLQELGECCQMIHTVCGEEHEKYCISEDNVHPQ